MARVSKKDLIINVFNRLTRLPEGFDEVLYLAANRDVAAAVASGKIRSGRTHWRMHGCIEKRPLKPVDYTQQGLPSDFNETLYLELNPDVQANVFKGGFASGADHYRQRGFKESRRWLRKDRQASEAQSVAMKSACHNLVADPLDYGRANPDVLGGADLSPHDLRRHWNTYGYREGRAPYGLNTFCDRSSSFKYWKKENTITFYGMLDASTGLGRAARDYVRIIQAAGYEVSTVSLDCIGGAFETVPATRHSEQAIGVVSSSKVNIFHINADMVHLFFADNRRHLLDDCYNIGIWVWELAHFRPEWIDGCGAFDEIWVPSEFCRAAIAATIPIPVFVMPHAVDIKPSSILNPRDHFRIPADVFVFGASFDVGSGIERKNPLVVIDAFRGAFGNSTRELLLLKYHSSEHDPDGIRRVHDLCAGLNNVRFIGHVLSDDEVSAIRAILDCYISAHRSEGFGLNVAEAVAFGTPVIATLYSGIEDFCTEDSIFPIDFALTELQAWIGPYPADALWADPSETSVSDQMVNVRRNPKAAALKATEARHRIAKTNSIHAISLRVKERIESLELFKLEPTFFKDWGTHRNATSHFTAVESLRFSVIVPVYNIEPFFLDKCITSVRDQNYKNWELILFDDGSNRLDTIDALRSMRGVDPRIKVVFGECNRGISAATNAAVRFSSGKFLAFLDNDDEIAANALHAMAEAINKYPTVDVLYSDEDKLDIEGRRCDHYFKPDWSPEHLESVMYLLHFLVVRRSLFLEVGGLREEFSGAQDYDLALRMTRVARKVVHVPEILYHWRMIPGSAAVQIDAKPKAFERARLAVEDHCRALGRPARVTINEATGLLRVQDDIPAGLPVTLVILTDNRSGDVPGRGAINLFDHFLESIIRTTETICSLKYLVVDNTNLEPKQIDKVRALGGRVISYQGSTKPFNFSAKANFSLRHVETELVIMLNDDLEVITPGWVDALIGLAQRRTTGIVGAKLRFPNDTIQHCGVVLGINEHVAHIYHQYPIEPIGYNGYTHVIRNYLAVTGACIATRMSCLIEVGLFDEKLRIDYNDIDICLKLHALGYRNIYTPYAELYHFEGTSQARTEPTPEDRQEFNRRWGYFLKGDPFYNPNLTKQELNYRAANPDIWDR